MEGLGSKDVIYFESGQVSVRFPPIDHPDWKKELPAVDRVTSFRLGNYFVHPVGGVSLSRLS